MTQYDAGPGDWSDREWESPDRKQKPQARRRRVTLPPWALLAVFVAIVILLCVGLVLIVRALRGAGDAKATPTPKPTATTETLLPTETVPAITAEPTITPTATVELPIEGTEEPPTFTEIAPGATVVVQGTLGAGLNLRAEPTTAARVVTNVKEGALLTVLEGPEKAGGYTWWKLRAANDQEGWAAANWLVLKTE